MDYTQVTISQNREVAIFRYRPHGLGRSCGFHNRSPMPGGCQPPVRRSWWLDHLSWAWTGRRLSHPQVVTLLLRAETVCTETGGGLDPYTLAMGDRGLSPGEETWRQ